MAITTLVSVKVREYGSSAAYTDLTPYLALGGLKWSRNDVEASSAGRTQDGIMHRARVSIKVRLDCKCRPLTTDEAHIVLPAIQPEWLQVQYLDPSTGAVETKKMYSNNIPATFLFMTGQEGAYTGSYWEGIEFPLIEE